MLLATDGTAAAADGCDFNTVDLRWDGGAARFSVEIADEFDERARGLMFRKHLPRYSGMLFVYDKPTPVSFWMKNTLIPLDMIFLGPDGVVEGVHVNAKPGSLKGISGGDNILAVLEINGGLSRELGIRPGAQLRHSTFGDEAAWPCD